MQILYAILFLLAILLLITYLFAFKKKKSWLFLLCASIIVVDLGYFLLSISKTVDFALFTNKVSYLASICSLVSMYFIVHELCGSKISKKHIMV